MYSEGGLCTCRIGLSSNHVILVWVGRIWYEVISRLIWYISAQLCREHWIYSIEEWLPMWGVVWKQYTRGTSSFLLLLWWKFGVLLAYSAIDGISLIGQTPKQYTNRFYKYIRKEWWYCLLLLGQFDRWYDYIMIRIWYNDIHQKRDNTYPRTHHMYPQTKEPV